MRLVVQVEVRRAGETEPVAQRTLRLEPGGSITFGRAPENDVVVPSPDRQVSSRHGRLECAADGTLLVSDVGSLNGTALGDRALIANEPAPLRPSDTVRFCEFELTATATVELAPATAVDFGATICTLDAAQHAQRTLERLEREHADHLLDSAETRRRHLQATLQAATDGLTAAQRDDVLRRIDAALAGNAASAATAATAPPEQPASAAPATAKFGSPDPLALACRRVCDELAARFVPGATVERVADAERLGRLLQQAMSSCLEWIAGSMQSRVVFEKEFGAEVTMLFQRSNNPLKAMNAGSLAEYLFDWSHDTPDETRHYYLEGLLRDLAEHQLGVLAGVRDAIGDIVARLAPERVMQAAMQDKGWSLASKAARAWATYEQLYAALAEERNKLFHEVISPAIQQGYLQQHDQAQKAAFPPNDGQDGEPRDRDP